MDFVRNSPFIKHLGVKQESVGNGNSLLVLDVRPELMNSLSMAHGGVLMTLLDLCMTQAARSVGNPHGEDDVGVVTIEMKSTFLQASTGTRIIARGHCVHRSGSLCFCEGELHDENERLLARGSGTFKPIRPRHPSSPSAERK